MMALKKVSKLTVLTLLATGYSAPVSAYLDPGTGSIILQGVLAAVAGAAIYLKMYWLKVKAYFSSWFSPNKLPDSGDKERESDKT